LGCEDIVPEASFGFGCKSLIRSSLHHGIEFEQNGNLGMKCRFCWHGVGLIEKAAAEGSV
jgi:hypothetical protein